MVQLRFQYVTAEKHFLVFAPAGRVFRLNPQEYEFALLQAERLISAGADNLILEAPGVMRLRVSGCSRSVFEQTAQAMRKAWRYHEVEVMKEYGGDHGRNYHSEMRECTSE